MKRPCPECGRMFDDRPDLRVCGVWCQGAAARDDYWLRDAPIAEVDAELRRLGLDPADVGAEGERVAREALAKRRGLGC